MDCLKVIVLLRLTKIRSILLLSGDGNQEIYIMNADGSELVHLVSVTQPTWSPEGKKIAFDNGEICAIDLNGSNQKRLTETDQFF